MLTAVQANIEGFSAEEMKTFVISMAGAHHRRNRMRALLASMGVAFEFVDGIDGRTLPDAEIRKFSFHQEIKLGRGELGCLLSHASIWKRMAADPACELALILEDDVHFSPGFGGLLANIRVDPDAIGLYRLETMLASVNISRRPRQAVGKYRVHKLLSTHAGTAAYIVNRKTAAHLSACYLSMRRAVDIELFSPERRTIGPIDVYQCVPAPCMQDMKFPASQQNAHLRSNITEEREDIAMGIFRREPDFIKLIKALLRPVYLKIFSLGLIARGMMRVQVKFD